MRHVSLAVAALSGALVLLISAPSALAGEPPNQNDPCSTDGRNSCGTLGIGSYENYRYGIRWFGDYRGAVEGIAHTFCLDLQYWYPSPKYRYVEDTTGRIRNRDGEPVPLSNLQRMAYALWHDGQSTNPDQQAAAMLYVHSLMGDARPGEIDPSALGPEIVDLYRTMSSNAARYHGPYRIVSTIPERIGAGATGMMTFRVLSVTGNAVPGVKLNLAVKGAGGVPRQVTTNDAGIASVTFTATAADGVDVTATTERIASTLPRIFVPGEPTAAINGQRLAAPSSQTVSARGGVAVAKAKIGATTKATAARLLVGQSLRDKVFITGALESWQGTVQAKIFGPFRNPEAIRCDGRPIWTATFEAQGPGTYTTPYATMRKVGWYTFQQVIPGDGGHVGLTTDCRDPAESFKVETQPTVETRVSSDRIAPDTEISDTIRVAGTAGEELTIRADLYGPFPSREAIRCDGQPIWTGNVKAAGNGELSTGAFVLTVPGYYTYRATIAATEFVRAVEAPCGDESETTIVFGQPKIETKVSAATIAPESTLTDTAIVTGLGSLTATVNVELFGPFRSRGAISCKGTPYWRGTFVAAGDGTYTTQPVKIEKVGYYTYRESILEAPPYRGVTTRCGEAAETALATSEPLVTTLVSNEVVAPGARITDLIRVSGLGRTAARIEVELFGPFAFRDAIACSGTPYWKGTVFVRGDGEVTSPPVKLETAGFYTYRETLVGSPQIKGYRTACAEVSETSLARPLILTGRGDTARVVAARDAGGKTPVEVNVSALGISAVVAPVRIDLAAGALGVPADIKRTGWWSDGAAPGATNGAVLIAGHVDSAKLGGGAFFRLKEARPGDRVQLVTRDGTTVTYRVISVKTTAKAQLPTDVFSLQGRARLVLVTCGGPFNEATGHYRDNVIVTAVPV
jgi:Sortase domain